MDKVQAVSLKDIHQWPVETDKLIFLWSGGIPLMKALSSPVTVWGGLLAEEAEFVRVDAVALNNEILTCSSKIMRVGLKLCRDIGQLVIVIFSGKDRGRKGDVFKDGTLSIIQLLPFFLLLPSVLLHLPLWSCPSCKAPLKYLRATPCTFLAKTIPIFSHYY